jgi:hypothetical protein
VRVAESISHQEIPWQKANKSLLIFQQQIGIEPLGLLNPAQQTAA